MDLQDYTFVVSILTSFDLRLENRLTKEWKRLQVTEWLATALIQTNNSDRAIPLIEAFTSSYEEAIKRPSYESKVVDGNLVEYVATYPVYPDTIVYATEHVECSIECIKAIKKLVLVAQLDERYKNCRLMKQ